MRFTGRGGHLISHARAAMRYWLMKSEPSDVSVDDVAATPNKTVNWYGVRNYQARNFMKDEMSVGDGVLFYHSSCPEPGHRRHRRGGVGALPRPDPVRSEEPLLRPEVDARGAALAARRRAAR